MKYPSRTSTQGFRMLAGALLLVASFALQAAIEFSDEEKEYLQSHPELTMCVDPDFMPYEYLDENGNYSGAISEYMKILEQRIGARFRVLQTDSWAQTKEFASQRKCDLVAAINQTAEREDYLGFTTPYLRIPSCLAFRKDDSRITGLDSMAGKKLAVVKGNVYNEAIKLDFPDIELIEVDDPNLGLLMVSQGEADAFAGALYSVKYQIKSNGITNLDTLQNRRYRSIIRVGVRNDAPDLFLIMNKAVKSLTGEDHLRIRRELDAISN